MNSKKISESTISRLFIYLREITKLADMHIHTISSLELGERLNISDAQVRKDLGYFGNFGVSGAGYNTDELKKALLKILGKERTWNVCVSGAGYLGSALISYPGFKELGLEIKACFDKSAEKVGKNIGGLTVQPVEELAKTVSDKNILIGIIAVPEAQAQAAADELIKAGVECIMNFAPIALNVGGNVRLKNVDLSRELETFTYFLKNKNGRKKN